MADATLVARALAGDEDAGAAFYGRHAAAIHAYAVPRVGRDRALAEDVTQEVFLDAWRDLRLFNVRRRFPAWLVGDRAADVPRRTVDEGTTPGHTPLNHASDPVTFAVRKAPF